MEWFNLKLSEEIHLGSKAASDSTLKQLTLVGYQILVLYFKCLTKRVYEDFFGDVIVYVFKMMNK